MDKLKTSDWIFVGGRNEGKREQGTITNAMPRAREEGGGEPKTKSERFNELEGD